MSDSRPKQPMHPPISREPWNLGQLRRLLESRAHLPDDTPVLLYLMGEQEGDRQWRRTRQLVMLGAGSGGRRVDRPDGPASEQIFGILCDYPDSEDVAPSSGHPGHFP